MKSLKITFGSILAFVAVSTLIYLGKRQYAPWIELDVPITALLVVASMMGSVALFKQGGAHTAARTFGFIFGSFLGFFAWLMGHLLTGERRIQFSSLIVGLIAVLIEAVGTLLLLRGAFRDPPMRPRPSNVSKRTLGAVLLLMAVLSTIGSYEAMTLNPPPDTMRAVIFGLFALLELTATVSLYISAFKKRPAVPNVQAKWCPTCHRAYPDIAQNFCLEDGTILLNPSDPRATLVNPPQYDPRLSR